MSSVLSEYPETLPAPMVGVVTLTERRKISTIGKIRNTRNVQRDRHGTRTVSFVYTPAQAAIFREWWKEWEQLGGGWFAANWPLPWQRGSNVFRFIDPPDWQLIGGGLDGQGYYSVRASVEIRGRGMLPTVEVMYLTSQPYPIYYADDMRSSSAEMSVLPQYAYEDNMGNSAKIFQVTVNGFLYGDIQYPTENLSNDSSIVEITATQTVYKDYDYGIESVSNNASIFEVTAQKILIGYSYPVESMSIGAQIIMIGN